MKGKEIITHTVRAEMPDMEQLRENSIRQATEEGVAKHNSWVKRLMPITACLTVVLVVSIVAQHVTNNNTITPGTPSDGTHHPPIEVSMRGLPVDHFSLANVEANAAVTNRLVFENFGAILGPEAIFAVVKVYDVEIIGSLSFGTQISNAVVLKMVYSREDFAEPLYIKIKQSIIKNHFCLGTTNLLRNGGVYLLPLSHDDDAWHIMGDMDVLFEIDEAGKVWSHSSFEDFKQYDGKSIESFIEDLQNMFSDEEFMLANSPFAVTLRGWTLADITITSKNEGEIDQHGYEYISYSFVVHEVLSVPKHDDCAPLEETGHIEVHMNEASTISLLQGSRYLIFLDKHKDEIYWTTSVRLIAEIGNDDTITAILVPDQHHLGTNIFTPYDGYKISDIREMVLRIEAWHKAQNMAEYEAQ